MAALQLRAVQGAMSFEVSGSDVFPGLTLYCGFPEAIGDAAGAVWFGDTTSIVWTEQDRGAWRCEGKAEGRLQYSLDVMPFDDCVEVVQSLTNRGNRRWRQSLAFNCVSPGSYDAIFDYECLRHWVGYLGSCARLASLPRVFGPRPTVQLYSVEGAPKGRQIPFVAYFQATPDVVLEPWIAIASADGRRALATVSEPALFLFQNIEYSCIHSAAGFGALRPGQTGRARTRIYLAAATTEEMRERCLRWDVESVQA
ncbi:MAG: hypothetical protein KA184_00085 [Candidatus Hydrogenedentes bacterium]|nr:hypothetical protein [Candidatus Hydrogenedentota bacterium]